MSDKLFKKLWSKHRLKLAPALALVFLSGCVSNQNAFNPPLSSEFSVSNDDIVLVDIDLVEREQYQILIGQMTSMLGKGDLTHEQKAQILYQLGLLYDRLGMDATARTMFMNSLVEVPDYARSYNFLGIYLASSERFAEAYDAYDAVLEIDPKEVYAYFNRGIALYYGNRAELGVQDLVKFYELDKNDPFRLAVLEIDPKEVYAYFNRGIALYYGNRAELGVQDLVKFYELDKNDPFRLAWLYILDREVDGQEIARQKLIERRNAIEKKVPWGLEVLDLLSGKISGHDLIESVRTANIEPLERARRLCEAYFYMAKEAAYKGEYKQAYDLFHLCLATNVSGYLEYRYARLEIARFERMEQVQKADQLAIEKQKEREELLKRQAQEAHKYFQMLNQKRKESENKKSQESTLDSSKSEDSTLDSKRTLDSNLDTNKTSAKS